MTKRIIEISSESCYLRFKNQQLVIEQQDEILGAVPIEDMSALVIDHPQTLITQTCLGKLLQENIMVISSDDKHQPIGMFLPLQANTLQSERFAAQVNIKAPLKKNLWKQIIQSKIALQGKLLKDLTGSDIGLSVLVKKVRSGDPDNIEAQAARRYWSKLFSDSNFRRERRAEDQNRFLNYIYAIIRALISRSLCASGLHPSLGLHHHNRYNAYCLADDLMEPYRPIADLHVWEIVQEEGNDAKMNKIIRSKLLNIVKREVSIKNERLTLQGAMQKTAQSLVRVINGEGKHLALPEF